MYQMLSVDNLFWNTAILKFIFNFFGLEKELSPEQLVTIKLIRNKALRGCIK